MTTPTPPICAVCQDPILDDADRLPQSQSGTTAYDFHASCYYRKRLLAMDNKMEEVIAHINAVEGLLMKLSPLLRRITTSLKNR